MPSYFPDGSFFDKLSKVRKDQYIFPNVQNLSTFFVKKEDFRTVQYKCTGITAISEPVFELDNRLIF